MVETYKHKFNKKYGFPKNTPHSLPEISRLTGYKLSGLKTIYEKGKGAFYSNPQSVRPHMKKAGADAWAKARVYASISKGSKSYKIDKTHLIKSK